MKCALTIPYEHTGRERPKLFEEMRFCRKTGVRLVLSLCWSASALQAAASEPAQLAIPYTPLSLTLDHTEPSEHVIGRFLQEVVASDSIVFDRFASPEASMSWAHIQ